MNAGLNLNEPGEDARENAFSFFELILAFALWILAMFFGGTLTTSGANPAFDLVAYGIVIQLPLLVYYEYTLGFSGRRKEDFGKVIPWVFNPKLIYGVFFILVVGLIYYVTGGTLESGFGAIIMFFLLALYLPSVIIFVNIVKWIRNAIISVTSLFPNQNVPTADERNHGSISSGHNDSTRSPRRKTVKVLSLSGLVFIPLGMGWVTGSPGLGIGVASLLLTSYEIIY